MKSPDDLLEELVAEVQRDRALSRITDPEVRGRVEHVARNLGNRAAVRLLLACMLAKLHRPELDPRKPYTEIGSPDSFSGRTYDEQFLTPFLKRHRLPCNPTTAFLTPALRNIGKPLLADQEIIGRPRRLYRDVLQLLDDVFAGRVSANTVAAEAIRLLLIMRDEGDDRRAQLLANLQRNADALPLASEDIVSLLTQHLKCKNASRLPVLVVAAAYQAVSGKLGERALPLKAHNAADQQTGALGDVEICLVNETRIRTVYEMKMKRVTRNDIDEALVKIARSDPRIDNYLFVTTDVIDDEIREYAAGQYEQTGGTEVAVLDCLGFLRHFLHLFHRSRIDFLNAYQALVLNEPDSAVSAVLKEAFLALRQAAESDA
jgi:hypothetical protein